MLQQDTIPRDVLLLAGEGREDSRIIMTIMDACQTFSKATLKGTRISRACLYFRSETFNNDQHVD